MQRVTDSLVLPGLVRQCGYHGFAVAPSGRGAICRDARAPRAQCPHDGRWPVDMLDEVN